MAPTIQLATQPHPFIGALGSRCSLLGLLVLALGCGDVTERTDTSDVSITVSGWQSDAVPQEPLEGVEVCELDTTNCVVTDGRGQASITMPLGRETGFSMTRQGFAPKIDPFVLQEPRESLTLVMIAAQHMADQHARIDSPYPIRDTGTILVFVDPQSSGVTLQLSEATAVGFYHEPDRAWNPDLSETTSFSAGGFAEVTPGDYQIVFGGAARDCAVLGNAWPGLAENSLRVPVRSGYITHENIICSFSQQ